jgi:NADPH:quinone reductase-like Zn-dependent oxidoreductase
MGAVNSEALAQRGIEGTNIMAGSATGPHGLEELAAMVTTGELKVPIAHVFSLEETPQALAQLQSGVQGKIVLDCRI